MVVVAVLVDVAVVLDVAAATTAATASCAFLCCRNCSVLAVAVPAATNDNRYDCLCNTPHCLVSVRQSDP